MNKLTGINIGIFPSGMRDSTANSLFQKRSSNRTLQALGMTNSTGAYNQVKYSGQLISKSGHSKRTIALGGGGVKSQSAQTLGSMDRLGRIKAAAIEASKGYHK